jgi:hypothetical protein
VALLVGAVAALAAGCGDRSNLLPPANASTLSDQLDAVREAVNAGDCSAANRALAQADATLKRVPSTVSRALRSRMRAGLVQLRTTVPRDCRAPETTETQTTETQTVTTETPTVTSTPETTSAPETTTTPTPTTPTPTTTAPEPPPTSSTPDTGGAEPDGSTAP